MDDSQEMEAWRRWRARCALGLLEAPERDRLTTVIAQRFRSMVRRIGGSRGEPLQAPSAGECAHLFESYCALHTRRDGKKYKEWLLTRGRRDLDTVQSGVMLLVRNVVREWVRDTVAVSDVREVSLHREWAPGLSLEQLLPGVETSEAPREVREWLERRIAEWRHALHPTEAVALRLRFQGRVFSDPRAVEEAGVGKSSLYKHHRRVLFRLSADLRTVFPDLEPAMASRVVLDALDRLGELIFSEKNAENVGSAAFERVEMPEDD